MLMIPMLGSFAKMTLIKGSPIAADFVAPHIIIETESGLEKLKKDSREIENDIAENSINKKSMMHRTAIKRTIDTD